MYNDIDKALIGKKVLRIFMNEDNLKFETDQGNVCFSVDGDCCSKSVFHDFIGVKNLFKGKEITKVEEVFTTEDGDSVHIPMDSKNYQDDIKWYGYRLIVEGQYGEESAVFSFRNYSNGYYGGSMSVCEEKEVLPEIFDNVIETAMMEDKD